MTNRAESLPEVHRSVEIPESPRFWRRLLAFSGPAYLVSVGYMDPGNWATDIEGGSRFGYALVWVLVMSNVIAILLQTLSARLGIVTGRDLAQACRESYPRPVALVLWILCEIAIAACDLAEVLGTAIGLNLLFGISLQTGVILTALDVFLLLAIQRLGIRKMEALILLLVGTIGACYVLEVVLAQPDWVGVAHGLVPSLPGKGALYVAIGIIGATVMPHNLYLHSSLVQTRNVRRTSGGMRQANRYNVIDSVVALNAALFINAAILILSASTFHRSGIEVTEIQQAHSLLAPLLGSAVASAAFAIALLCAGQSSTLTGTLAGQIVMEGFLDLRMRPWIRRLITRLVAVVPAVVVVSISGDQGTYDLLIFSQVILSLQLPFAIIPLVQFTGDRRRMGEFASGTVVKILAWSAAAGIVALNARLSITTVADWAGASSHPRLVTGVAVVTLGAVFALLTYVTVHPWISRRRDEALPLAATSDPIVAVAAGYRRIALALAAREHDRKILEHGLALATSSGATVLLVHVVEGASSRVHGRETDGLEAREDRAYLETMRRAVATAGIPVEVRLLFGDPVRELTAMVEREGVDLLVMGGHGHRLVGDLFLGSTIDPVRHKVRIPVFVVRT